MCLSNHTIYIYTYTHLTCITSTQSKIRHFWRINMYIYIYIYQEQCLHSPQDVKHYKWNISKLIKKHRRLLTPVKLRRNRMRVFFIVFPPFRCVNMNICAQIIFVPECQMHCKFEKKKNIYLEYTSYTHPTFLAIYISSKHTFSLHTDFLSIYIYILIVSPPTHQQHYISYPNKSLCLRHI